MVRREPPVATQVRFRGGPTFDMSGGLEPAHLTQGCPLDGVVGGFSAAWRLLTKAKRADTATCDVVIALRCSLLDHSPYGVFAATCRLENEVSSLRAVRVRGW